ncbi:MAG: ATPase domain-containing protein [Nitrososphaerales archaeon]
MKSSDLSSDSSADPELNGVRIKGSELLKSDICIPTGSKALDRVLDGGIHGGVLTDFYGESGSGKTQLCHQLCVNAVNGSNDGGVAYIDTASGFRPERLVEIAEARGLNSDSISKRVFVVSPRSVSEQLQGLEDLQKLKPILIVLDNLIENFLLDFQSSGSLSLRQDLLFMYLHRLSTLAIERKIPVVVTNIVRNRLNGGMHDVEAGGSVPLHLTHVKVHLSRHGKYWTARTVRPLPSKNASFLIKKAGIADLSS